MADHDAIAAHNAGLKKKASPKVYITAVPRKGKAPMPHPRRDASSYPASELVKHNVNGAFLGLGGVNALINWARSNPDAFYKAYIKLAPKDVHVSGQIERLVVNRVQYESDSDAG